MDGPLCALDIVHFRHTLHCLIESVAYHSLSHSWYLCHLFNSAVESHSVSARHIVEVETDGTFHRSVIHVFGKTSLKIPWVSLLHTAYPAT